MTSGRVDGRLILVVGPPLAGTDAVIGALGRELPEHVLIGLDDAATQRAPDVVLAVVSAVAPMTRTDWDPIERAAVGTDLVIGLVSKIDAHRGWREVLDADRALVAGWSACRRSMTWVGAAAAPDLGEPCLDDVVALLRNRLANPEPATSTALRNNEVRPSAGPRPAEAAAVEVRSALQRTRMRLLTFTRERCSALRGTLREDASAVPVGGVARFEGEVSEQARRFLAELDDEIARALQDAAVELALEGLVVARPARRHDPPDVTRPPSSSRRLEGRLMAVLGGGFGLGIALAFSRLLAGLDRGPSLVGLAAGFAVGLTLVVWVVRTRGLLHDRALLDRWVTEVAASLRWHGEAVVAERALAAELACVQARAGRASGAVTEGGEWGGKDVTDQCEW